MEPISIQLILALLPHAEKLAIYVGGEIKEFSATHITSKADLVKMLEESKSQGWPDLEFKTPAAAASETNAAAAAEASLPPGSEPPAEATDEGAGD